jgi:hypothetical protein
LSYLSDEYKILQDKLDKIGGFRFTIKGWSVTVVIGGLVAAVTGKSILPVVVGIVLTVCLVGFFTFERQQVLLSRRFGRRALDIEREIDEARRRNRWRSQFSSPRIARSILTGTPFELLRRLLDEIWSADGTLPWCDLLETFENCSQPVIAEIERRLRFHGDQGGLHARPVGRAESSNCDIGNGTLI